MNLDKFIQLENYRLSKMSSSLIQDLKDRWISNDSTKGLDTIHIYEAEMNMLADDKFDYDKEEMLDLLENPALFDFKLIIHARGHINTISFKKTLRTSKFSEFENRGGKYRIKPIVDIYMDMCEEDSHVIIGTINHYEYLDKDTCEFDDGVGVSLNTVNIKRLSRYFNEYQIPNAINESLKEAMHMFLTIQNVMKKKPQVFVDSKGRTYFHKSTTKDYEPGYENIVRVVKTIRINSERLKKYGESQNHKNCPCWGVVGHYREYKNGHKVWIAPFKKGRERMNNATYVAKNYQLEG